MCMKLNHTMVIHHFNFGVIGTHMEKNIFYINHRIERNVLHEKCMCLDIFACFFVLDAMKKWECICWRKNYSKYSWIIFIREKKVEQYDIIIQQFSIIFILATTIAIRCIYIGKKVLVKTMDDTEFLSIFCLWITMSPSNQEELYAFIQILYLHKCVHMAT